MTMTTRYYEETVETASNLRRGGNTPSRGACWICGLRPLATIHGNDHWWQHDYEPAILTKIP